MPTQSIEEIRRLALNLGHATYANAYMEVPLVYPQITTRLAAAEQMPFGHRAVASIGLGDLAKRQPGKRYEADSTREGYVRLLAIQNYGKTVSIPREVIDGAGGMAAFEKEVFNFADEIGRGARRKKEGIVARMFQDGRIAAGVKATFDQTYTGNEDANVGKIYDGKPFFAATSNAHPFKSYTASGDQGVNLTATLALSTANLQTAITNVQKYAGFDERGNVITMRHNTLLVPTGLEFTAQQIITSAQTAETANNGVNVIKDRMKVVVSDWIADSGTASGWWTLDPRGVMVFDEDVPRIRVWDDYDTNSVCMACDVYFGAAPWDWRYAAAHNMATS